MQIGEVIRKHRKLKNMTQEEMAARLGVTAPAVNKWENGNSFPDIMLLAPIARLLDITLDMLFSFREELTGDEIGNIVREMDVKFKEESYDEVFQWAKKKIEQYPNCEQLIWQLAVMLDAQHLTKKTSDTLKYDEYICGCYSRALNSNDEGIRSSAADSLFGFYIRKEEYEKAESYLTYFSKQNPERKRKQAYIYSKTNRIQEAYKAYEELIFSDYQIVNFAFQGIYFLAVQENDMEKARMIVEKQDNLAKVFEMGEYYEASCRLDMATTEKDADATIKTMEAMFSSVDRIDDFSKASLYEHLSFSKISEEFVSELKDNLLKCFRDEEIYGFLKDDSRWQKLIKEQMGSADGKIR